MLYKSEHHCTKEDRATGPQIQWCSARRSLHKGIEHGLETALECMEFQYLQFLGNPPELYRKFPWDTRGCTHLAL